MISSNNSDEQRNQIAIICFIDDMDMRSLAELLSSRHGLDPTRKDVVATPNKQRQPWASVVP